MFVDSFNLSPVHCAIILGFSQHLETFKKKEFYSIKQLHIILMYLKKHNQVNHVLGNLVAKTGKIAYFSYYISDADNSNSMFMPGMNFYIFTGW